MHTDGRVYTHLGLQGGTVLSDPWTKDLLPHRMAAVTKCRRVSRDRLTEAA